MDQKVGQSILDSIGEGLANGLGEASSRSLDESLEVAGTRSKNIMESFGPPKVNKNETISIPVSVATVVEMDDSSPSRGEFEKIDQAFLDRNQNLILQKMVLSMNPGDEFGFRSRRRGLIFFDQENFKLEYVEGGIVRLTTTFICDLRPILSEVRSVRWKLEDTLWETSTKAAK